MKPIPVMHDDEHPVRRPPLAARKTPHIQVVRNKHF